jgi:hypothetical protein
MHAIEVPTVLSMAPKSARSNLQKGQDWLLSCTHNPTGVRRAWASEECAQIESGEHWRVAEGSLLPSLRAMKHMGSQRLGPVLADVSTNQIWWLLPSGLSDELDDVHQLTVHPPGWLLACPPVLYGIDKRLWLERPDGSGRLTNPKALRAAFSPRRRIAAGTLG